MRENENNEKIENLIIHHILFPTPILDKISWNAVTGCQCELSGFNKSMFEFTN